MAFEYIDDLTTADVAFRSWGDSLEETFRDACEAMSGVMIEDLGSIEPRERRALELHNEELDLLLFDLLQELIYYKDAEELLLRVDELRITELNEVWHLEGVAVGEEIDRRRHEMRVDVKAVTLHLFKLEQTARGWETQIIVDV